MAGKDESFSNSVDSNSNASTSSDAERVVEEIETLDFGDKKLDNLTVVENTTTTHQQFTPDVKSWSVGGDRKSSNASQMTTDNGYGSISDTNVPAGETHKPSTSSVGSEIPKMEGGYDTDREHKKGEGLSDSPSKKVPEEGSEIPKSNHGEESNGVERTNPVSSNPVNSRLDNSASSNNGSLGKKSGLDGGEKKKKEDEVGSERKKSDSEPNVVKPGDKKAIDSSQAQGGRPVTSPKNRPGAKRSDTDYANSNLAHANRVKAGKAAEDAAPTKKPIPNKGGLLNSGSGTEKKSGLGSKLGLGKNSGPKKPSLSSIGAGGKKGAKNKAAKKTGKAVASGLAKLGALIASNPAILAAIFLVGIMLFIIILLCVDVENNKKGGGNGKCTYSLVGVTSSGSVDLENLQVELINCDGTASNYEVLETVDFEKYVLGVALAEYGEVYDEGLKAQIIAARNFALTRNSGMCPGNPDGCFYGYNTSTGKIRMRACENDQVYWDYDKDIYRADRGSVSVYSPEVNSGTVWKTALSPEDKAKAQELANEVKGKVLVDDTGKVVSTNYNATMTTSFADAAKEGLTYDKILEKLYGSGDFSSAVCTSYGNIDYGDYVLSSEGHEILHQPLGSFLESKGSSVEEFSSLIAANVEKNGYGTRAGVVTAGVTLIAELGNNYGVKVPYYWGGGHYDGVVVGALDYWGSTKCHTYANGQSYDYCGFDCSGFVPWAIKNGGFNMAQMLAGDFQNISGARRVSLSSSSPSVQPGDLLESSHHITLVVDVDEANNQYIIAHASGNAAGVLFSNWSYSYAVSAGYWGVDMEGYYSNPANVRSK